MISRKSLTVHYRRLSDATNAFSGTSLEDAIRNAVEHKIEGTRLKSSWKLRAFDPSPGQSDTYLMNLYHDDSETVFGDLTQYTEGHMQALLDQQPDKPSLSVEQQPAPTGKEYIHSIMYWLVKDNHVFVFQSRSLSTKNLEQYLTWLLKDRAGAIQTTGQVILDAKFDAADVGGDLDDIREIIVGGNTTSLKPGETEDKKPKEVQEVEAFKEAATKRTWREKAVEVLRAIMNNEADVQEFLGSIPDDASLQVDVHIGYKTKRRKASRAPMQHALRNLPEGEVTAVGKTGILTGNDIRLSYPVRVAMVGSLINPKDAREKLFSAYKHFVENGKIEP